MSCIAINYKLTLLAKIGGIIMAKHNCDRLCEKGSYSFSKFSTLVIHISSGFKAITFILHHTIMVCYGNIMTKFQSGSKFKSQVMGFQICAIGISYKTPFCRASHNWQVLEHCSSTIFEAKKQPHV